MTRFAGTGTTVERVEFDSDRPALLTATHRGNDNFWVSMVGHGSASGEDFLAVNEIGDYSGVTAFGVYAAAYDVQVEADGAWTLRVSQPLPLPDAPEVPVSLSGTGSRVVQIQVKHEILPVIRVTVEGDDHFFVWLLDMRSDWVEEVFEGYAPVTEQTRIDDIDHPQGALPEGNYLVEVHAHGRWTLSIQP